MMKWIAVLLLTLPAFGQSQIGGYPPVSNVPIPTVYGQGLLFNGTSLAPSLATQAGYYPGLILFGDSNTCGYGASNYTADPAAPGNLNVNNGYAYVMQPLYGPGTGFANYCHTGDYMADQVTNKLFAFLNPGYTKQPTVVEMLGTNDANLCGLTAGCENNFQYGLQTMIVQATVPLANKIVASSMTKTGTWTNNAALNGGNTVYSGVSGSTLSATVTTVGSLPIYVTWGANDAAGGSATVSIDGTVVDTLVASGFNGQAIHTFNSVNQDYFTKRYVPASGAGSHTVLFTTLNSSNFELAMISTPTPKNAISGPRLFVGGILKQQSDAKSATTQFYDSLAKNTAATFAADGLAVQFVDVRPYISSANYKDAVHLNDAGYVQLADAFNASIAPLQAGASFTGGSLTSTLVQTASTRNQIVIQPSAANQQAYLDLIANGGRDWTVFSDFGATGWFGVYDNQSTVLPLAISTSASHAYVAMPSFGVSGFNSGTSAEALPDAAISRCGPNCITVGNGAPGDKSGAMQFGSATIGTGTSLTRYARYAVALTPAAVAATSCAAQSFTVTGVAAADTLIGISKPTEQAGLSVAPGHVTALNTATLNFCNVTAAPITPTAAESYSFVVVQ